MENILEGFPVIIEIPVAWGEMDALRHVNNVVYFRYFESARAAYLRKMKAWQSMDRTGIGLILASTRCRYRVPLTYPDTVSVGTRVVRIEKDRFTMEHCLVSQRWQKIAAQGEAVLVSYDYRTNKKVLMPEEWRKYIAHTENMSQEYEGE